MTGAGTLEARQKGFTLVEVIAGLGIVVVLCVAIYPFMVKSIRYSKKTGTIGNLKSYVAADIMYLADKGEFPAIDTIIPSSISRDRLAIIADYGNLVLPRGSIGNWPKRSKQPTWMSDPVARISGFAEGMTLGGGIYTGYVYFGRIEESSMVQSGMATLTNPERAADRKNLRRGVLWTTILAEFSTSAARRYECFHYTTTFAYPDFRFKADEIDGQFRGWSDGSVEWVPQRDIKFGGADIQVRHFMGNYYY